MLSLRPDIAQARVLVGLLILLSCTGLWAADEGVRLTPGAKFTLSFPELPQTLAGDVPSLQVVLPSDYQADRLFPLHLWLGGGSGGKGGARSDLYGGKRFIFIGLPLFHADGNRPKDHVLYKDAVAAWAAYQVMLAKLEKTVPNILPRKGVAQGFSNGGHTISILLSNPETQAGMFGYFGSFVLWESIYMLKPTPGMAGRPLLVLAGDRSLAKPGAPAGGFDGSPKGDAMELVKQAAAAKIAAELIVMKDTGHASPKEYLPGMLTWLDAKAIRPATDRLQEARQLVAGKRWSEALGELQGLRLDALAATESDEVAGMLRSISERADKELAALTAKPATSEAARKTRAKALEKIAATYPGTPAAQAALALTAPATAPGR